MTHPINTDLLAAYKVSLLLADSARDA